MKAVRLLLAIASLVVALALGAVVALAAPGAVTGAASPSAGAAKAAYCPAGEKNRRSKELARAQAQLKAFSKGMRSARTRYFRTHRSKKQRIAFVRKQNTQLKTLRATVKRTQRELRRCS